MRLQLQRQKKKRKGAGNRWDQGPTNRARKLSGTVTAHFCRPERNFMSEPDDKKLDEELKDEELDKVSGGTGPHQGHSIGGRGIDPQDERHGHGGHGADPDMSF
jgi:hypothetical protein